MRYFVGGYPRSGTTLLGNLLCGDERTNPPIAEVSYLEYMMFPYDAFIAGWTNNSRGLFSSEEEFWEFHRGILKQFLDHVQDKHGCEHLVVKRPFLTRWFPTLAQMFEDDKFIVIVRDPRDVIGSMKMVQRKHYTLPPEKQKINPYLDQTLTDFAYGYTDAIKHCIMAPQEIRRRFTFVVYEDLVNNLEQSMIDIGEEIGLELKMVEDNWNMYVSSPRQQTNPFHSKWWGKPITNANIGKWKSQLDREEVEMVETICLGIMEGFGYERAYRKMEGGTRRLRTPQG